MKAGNEELILSPSADIPVDIPVRSNVVVTLGIEFSAFRLDIAADRNVRAISMNKPN
jgi:hypothetical protein